MAGAPWPEARPMEVCSGEGAAQRRLSRVRPAVTVVAVVAAVSMCCYAALVSSQGFAAPTETVAVGGRGDGSTIGNSGVSRSAEKVIQSAVRKAVSVNPLVFTRYPPALNSLSFSI